MGYFDKYNVYHAGSPPPVVNTAAEIAKAKANIRANQLLESIDAFLVDPANVTSAGLIWDILGSLRGPDSVHDGQRVKESATIPVRRAAFPKLATASGNGLADFYRPSLSLDSVKSVSTHFNSHTANALIALRALGRIPGR